MSDDLPPGVGALRVCRPRRHRLRWVHALIALWIVTFILLLLILTHLPKA